MKYSIENNLNRIGIVIQARMSSKRFPKKMLALINDMPLIKYVYKRCQTAGISKVIVATSTDSSDDALYEYCCNQNIDVVRGDLENVLDRFVSVSKSLNIDYVVRVCGDTPFVDTEGIRELVTMLIKQKLDYCGYDRQCSHTCFYSEAMTFDALQKSLELTKVREDQEHVTKYILDHLDDFKVELIKPTLFVKSMESKRLTVDYPEDVFLVDQVARGLESEFSFSAQDVVQSFNLIESADISKEGSVI